MGRPTDLITRARHRWAGLPRWVRWPALGFGGLLALGVLALVVLWFTVDLPEDPPELRSAVVVGADGSELAVLSQEGQRFEVHLDEVAPVVVDALLAAEDRRFYEHNGVDPVGLARALWHNVRGGRAQGGSTLTQQLVKNEFLSSERTLWRKAREAVLSVKLERSEDKDQILERYLNTVYFGRGAYGIEAAARLYFDRHAADLSVEQAALLVGLLRAPESADPTEAPDEAMARRQVVLQDLVETGHLTQAQADAATRSPLGAADRTGPAELSSKLAPHFVEWVRQQVIQAVGEDALYGAGLRVVTTLDLRAQAAAEQAVADVLTDPAGPQAALVALDTDGAIRAYVGGRDYAALKVDLVRGADGGGSGRQPGSSFKPFVLQAALEQGITLNDRYPAPATLDLEVEGAPWSVGNYGGEGYGDLTVAEATASSVNTVYAQMLAQVGPQAVVEAAQTAGIDAELEPLPSIALGAEEVSPLDLASAYLTFADDGIRLEPYAISRIEDSDGNVMWEPDRPEPHRVLNSATARGVNAALQGVVDHGTGRAADIGRPQAGKTGTTQNNVDAWFAGYIPGYATVVWMGYPDASQPMDDVQGRSVTGGSFPARIWAAFMEVAVQDRDPVEFPEPPDDVVSAPTSSSVLEMSSADSSTTSSSDTTSTTATDDSTTTTEGDGGTSSTTSSSSTTSTTTATETATGDATSTGGTATDPP